MARKSSKVVPVGIRLLKACAAFGSKDETRPNLAGVRVTTPFQVAATNGHTLIQIDSDDAHGLPIGQIVDVKAAIKCMEVGAPIQSSTDLVFPNMEHVIPPLGRIDRGESLETRAIAVDPSYMADAMAALSFCDSVRITYATDDASPLRIDGRADGLRVIVVIMPVRQRFAQRGDAQDPWFTDDPAKCAA